MAATPHTVTIGPIEGNAPYGAEVIEAMRQAVAAAPGVRLISVDELLAVIMEVDAEDHGAALAYGIDVWAGAMLDATGVEPPPSSGEATPL